MNPPQPPQYPNTPRSSSNFGYYGENENSQRQFSHHEEHSRVQRNSESFQAENLIANMRMEQNRIEPSVEATYYHRRTNPPSFTPQPAHSTQVSSSGVENYHQAEPPGLYSFTITPAPQPQHLKMSPFARYHAHNTPVTSSSPSSSTMNFQSESSHVSVSQPFGYGNDKPPLGMNPRYFESSAQSSRQMDNRSRVSQSSHSLNPFIPTERQIFESSAHSSRQMDNRSRVPQSSHSLNPCIPTERQIFESSAQSSRQMDNRSIVSQSSHSLNPCIPIESQTRRQETIFEHVMSQPNERFHEGVSTPLDFSPFPRSSSSSSHVSTSVVQHDTPTFNRYQDKRNEENSELPMNLSRPASAISSLNRPEHALDLRSPFPRVLPSTSTEYQNEPRPSSNCSVISNLSRSLQNAFVDRPVENLREPINDERKETNENYLTRRNLNRSYTPSSARNARLNALSRPTSRNNVYPGSKYPISFPPPMHVSQFPEGYFDHVPDFGRDSSGNVIQYPKKIPGNVDDSERNIEAPSVTSRSSSTKSIYAHYRPLTLPERPRAVPLTSSSTESERAQVRQPSGLSGEPSMVQLIQQRKITDNTQHQARARERPETISFKMYPSSEIVQSHQIPGISMAKTPFSESTAQDYSKPKARLQSEQPKAIDYEKSKTPAQNMVYHREPQSKSNQSDSAMITSQGQSSQQKSFTQPLAPLPKNDAAETQAVLAGRTKETKEFIPVPSRSSRDLQRQEPSGSGHRNEANLLQKYDQNAPSAFKGLTFKTIDGGYSDIVTDKLEENYKKYRNLVVSKDNGNLMTPHKFLCAICNRMKINVHVEFFRFHTPDKDTQYRVEVYVGGFCGVAHGQNAGFTKQLAAVHVLERMRVYFRSINPTSYAIYPGSRYTRIRGKLEQLCRAYILGEPHYVFHDTKYDRDYYDNNFPRWECSVIVQNKEAIVRSDHKNFGGNLAAKNMYNNFVKPPAVPVVQLKDYFAIGVEAPMLKEVHPSLLLYVPCKKKLNWIEENGVTSTDPWLHDATNESRYLFQNLSPEMRHSRLVEFRITLEDALQWFQYQTTRTNRRHKVDGEEDEANDVFLDAE